MATTVPLSRVDHYVTAPCKLKNNHSHCIGEITSTTCTLDSSGLSVVGYNTKEESDPTTSFSEILSGEESKPRSQSQLTAIQSHRVLGILDNVMEKLKFLACTTPDVQQLGIKLTMLVGDDVCSTVQEHKSLQQYHESLIREQRLLMQGPSSDDGRKQEVQTEISQLKCDLCDQTTKLFQRFMDTPDIPENMQKIHQERDNMIILLEKLSQEVTRNGTFSTLTTWLEGNAARVKYGSELSNREQVITDAVGHLRSKLDEVIEGNKQEMTEKRQTLKRVKEIRTSAQDVETEEANIIKKKYAVGVESKLEANAKERKDKMRNLKALKKQMEDEMVTHKTTMDSMQRRSKKLVEETKEWEQRRLCVHGKLEGELEVLTKEREEVLNRLVNLRHRYDKEEEEKKKKEEEMRAAELQRMKHYAAATIIQHFFRFHSNKRRNEGSSSDQTTNQNPKLKKKKTNNGERGKGKKTASNVARKKNK